MDLIKSTFTWKILNPDSEEFNKIRYDKWMDNINNVKYKINEYVKENNLDILHKYKDRDLHLFIWRI